MELQGSAHTFQRHVGLRGPLHRLGGEKYVNLQYYKHQVSKTNINCQCLFQISISNIYFKYEVRSDRRHYHRYTSYQASPLTAVILPTLIVQYQQPHHTYLLTDLTLPKVDRLQYLRPAHSMPTLQGVAISCYRKIC